MPPQDPVSRPAAGLAKVAGAAVELERPGDPERGDYATNVVLRVAPAKRRVPRDLAAEIPAGAVGLGVVDAAEPAGPRFVKRERKSLALTAGMPRGNDGSADMDC